STTAQELDTRERESMLEWRRGLAELQEVDDLLLTPFERNIEVWRQLWRVIERSDLVVQIVDARNPLLFRSDDLERYVKEVDKKKRNLLLVNKADMMTLEQRQAWADYFVQNGINFRFFSAELAKELNEAKGNAFDGLEDEAEESEEDTDSESADSEVEEELEAQGEKLAQETKKVDLQDEKDADEQWVDEEKVGAEAELDGVPLPVAEQTRILTTDDLEALFLKHSPAAPEGAEASEAPRRKTSIGLVGYPNVGKSSTINALLGAKKVSVS
ncbi:P-loop containing nucleoside triphosphate hydrolase protein, partial [Hortaea werneckii]